MSDAVEAHEHAEHAAHSGRKYTALLIAVLAAGLAFSEQGAQHADTRMTAGAVAANDSWAQYQAKSIRLNEARDFADMAKLLPPAPARDALVARLGADILRFDADPQDGRKAIAARAHAQEEARDAAHLKLDAFDNAAAALQLAIVLATASVITGSTMLVAGAAGLGAIGALLGLLGLFNPGLAAW